MAFFKFTKFYVHQHIGSAQTGMHEGSMSRSGSFFRAKRCYVLDIAPYARYNVAFYNARRCYVQDVTFVHDNSAVRAKFRKQKGDMSNIAPSCSMNAWT